MGINLPLSYIICGNFPMYSMFYTCNIIRNHLFCNWQMSQMWVAGEHTSSYILKISLLTFCYFFSCYMYLPKESTTISILYRNSDHKLGLLQIWFARFGQVTEKECHTNRDENAWPSTNHGKNTVSSQGVMIALIYQSVGVEFVCMVIHCYPWWYLRLLYTPKTTIGTIVQ